ncbi:hypothetical protein DTW90_33065 [Neorhizobium sp. P12A]|uniref:DUF6894 family protein n=1 Tax=Neorhizobium sp. P12A TaxID=2268027 RepID=UPI0011EDAE6A|nr:hypothetical protein [Neorhizobium sp. P12A]KAA0687986.1 hypothetical protein DTW90_33065 [Neorhizobium sp. P12A]
MKRYFFDLHNGDGPTTDDCGLELETRGDISRHVAKILLDVARDELREQDRVLMSVTVRDAEGKTISVAALAFNNEWV